MRERTQQLRALQAEIDARMRRGEAFATVEAEVINSSTVSQAEKAALWLYGWSFVDSREQRREALAHIELLATTTAPRPEAPLQLLDTDTVAVR